ncbi:1,9-bis(guanidino)-5-aza-nonane synthase [Humisphaera borealis]|uniref:Deoxyhypusine synthase n=1 Tax=Humisphaera borealis TaxID=2807512 RepID=A0A7M2WXF7_9BACT|nr:deoxyhypusine synthase [Humisphaera borealis]QOV90083.1 deoxyhypusine synthase [Humisphaera borealis]
MSQQDSTLNTKPLKATSSHNQDKYFTQEIEHIDILKNPGIATLVEGMKHMAFTSRDLYRAADIYERNLRDRECGIILTLAGSMISAGLKKVFVDMIRNNMVDAIVSTGANMVDQDFFEALGFKHWMAEERLKSGLFDGELRDHAIDRIYDTLISEDDLRVCDDVTGKIFEELEPRAYSSRELLRAFGEYLDKNGGPKCADSIIYEAYKRDIPIFCPAFSDCSAGFGLVAIAASKGDEPHMSWDGGKDFYELTQIKIKNAETGIFMVGGGVPKNFTQDIVVAAEVLGHDAPMHKYAVQVTVADVRDGALSSSTLKEASSWGKVDTVYEQMVFSEATLAVPLIVGYAYHRGAHKGREGRKWNNIFEPAAAMA